MKKKLMMVLALLLVCVVGVSAMKKYEHGDPKPVAKMLSQNLEQAGLKPEALEKAGNEHLKGDAYTLHFSGGTLYLYAYTNEDKAAQDLLDSVGQDGFFYQDTQRLAGMPHYFLRDNVVVFYLGEEIEILQLLERVCGPQLRGAEYQL